MPSSITKSFPTYNNCLTECLTEWDESLKLQRKHSMKVKKYLNIFLIMFPPNHSSKSCVRKHMWGKADISEHDTP